MENTSSVKIKNGLPASVQDHVKRIEYKHLNKTQRQLQTWFNAKIGEDKVGNMDFDSFLNWYSTADKCCHYCQLAETECQKIVRLGYLSSKMFPKDGLHGRGTSRAMWLEIDRYDPNGKYEIGNIVLCCYFCNNDKSDIFHGDDYKTFAKDRVGFLKQL